MAPNTILKVSSFFFCSIFSRNLLKKGSVVALRIKSQAFSVFGIILLGWMAFLFHVYKAFLIIFSIKWFILKSLLINIFEKNFALVPSLRALMYHFFKAFLNMNFVTLPVCLMALNKVFCLFCKKYFSFKAFIKSSAFFNIL